MKALSILLVVAFTLFSASTAFAQAAATPPYTVSVFATSVPGSYTKPDSIAVVGSRVFVGYGNGVATDGSDGKSSTIVEYAMNGNVLNTYSVKGHNDGLRYNTTTKLLWSMQNEDANPNLVTIDPVTGTETVYTFGPTPHGGGYDDIAFRNGNVYLSASNPSNNPNTAPAIVKAQISGSTVNVTPALLGNANAIDVATGAPVSLNLQDPDSMIFNPVGDLVLDSQSDGELIVIRHFGSTDQEVFRLALSLGGSPVQIDDTVFATSSEGIILLSDRDGETVYSITRNTFAPSDAYSATPNSVGRLDFDTGVITPVVTGLSSPHGMVFINQ
jgi:hypothetical protein